jgi:hypothetical protein
MGVREEVAKYIDHLKEEWAALSTLRHGCLCGAGSVGEAPIDELDICCQTHDSDYEAVGHSADTMWTVDGLIKTAPADRKLATCAGSAALVSDHEMSHPDPEGFRARLIDLFNTRAWVGEQLAAAQAAGEAMGDLYQDVSDWASETADQAWDAAGEAVESFRGWMEWAAPWIASAEPTPDDVRAGFNEHMTYLASVGVSREEIDAVVRDSGVTSEQLQAEGLDAGAVA